MQNSLISKFKTELMGISALGVLITHSKDFFDYIPLCNLFVSYCGIVVYIFSFLSGFGLDFSMKKVLICERT